jgi:hypothetical protein
MVEPCRWMCCLEEELQTLYDLRKISYAYA